MRKSLFLVALALCLLAAPAVMAKSTITISPLALMSGTVAVEFETAVARSPQLTWGLLTSFKGGKVDFGGGVRYYVDGRAHDGLYFGGYGMLIDPGSGGGGAVQTGLGALGVAGYKWQLDNGMVLDLGASVGIPAPVYSGLRFGVGLAF